MWHRRRWRLLPLFVLRSRHRHWHNAKKPQHLLTTNRYLVLKCGRRRLNVVTTWNMLLGHHCDSCGTEKPQLFVNNHPESCFEMCGRRRRTSFRRRQQGWTVTCKRKGLETGATTGPRNNDDNQPRIGSWRNTQSNCKNSKLGTVDRGQPANP